MRLTEDRGHPARIRPSPSPASRASRATAQGGRALLVALALLSAGCTGMPPESDQQREQREAKERAEWDAYYQGQEQEAQRDLARLNPPAPRRQLEKELTQEDAELTQRKRLAAETLSRRGATALPVAPVLPAFNPLDDVIVSLEMDNTDVRHILTALAKETGMNLLMDPEVLRTPANVSISFRNVPASRVFQETMRLADLHGTIDDNVLRIAPYQEATYFLGFLETAQNFTLSSGGDVLGGSSSAGGAGAGGTKATMNRLTGRFSVTGTGPGNPNPYSQLSAILSNLIAGKGSFQLNPATGLLYVRAKPSVVRVVSKIVEDYKRILGRQILIDARILEVTLTDNFDVGIDWGVLRDTVAKSFGMSQTLTGTLGGPLTVNLGNTSPAVPESNFGATFHAGRTTLVINLLKKYGNVKVISNPTVRTKHNQPAMISVGKSNAYVRETTVSVTGGTNAIAQTSVQVDSVFDGLLIGVVPFITEDGRISLLVNPVQSSVNPDSLNLVAISTDSKVSLPQVDLKEITTVLEMRDGETVLIGGLIDKRITDARTSVPYVSELPVFGRLFKSTSEQNAVRELVILLHVKII